MDLLSEMDTSRRQKISKNTVELKAMINQLDIFGNYRLFLPTTLEYTFLSSTH